MADTIRVLLLGEVSGTRNGAPWPPRLSVIELPVDEAASLIRGGMARPAVDEPESGVERAVADTAAVEARPLTTRTGPGRRARTTAVVEETDD